MGYVRSGDLHLAYRVMGEEDERHIVWVSDWFTTVEPAWSDPPSSLVAERLMRLGRFVVYDQRGTGRSDPVSLVDLPSHEQYVDDLRVVVDAVGAERVVLLGQDSAGPLSILFAATHPERVEALVLVNSHARPAWAPDHQIGVPPEDVERILGRVGERWGTGSFMRLMQPSAPDTPEMRAEFARLERQTSSPEAAVAFMRLAFETDVRVALPLVQAPTLIIHRRDNRWIPLAHGRHLADHIPGARLVELPGADHTILPSAYEDVLDEIEEFLTGNPPTPQHERVLATVLFTDIVSSTERQAQMGDRRWKELLDAHDALVARQLDRFRGRAVKSTGDGILATFDGPARAIQCAVALRDGARQLGLELRAGLHTGEIEVRADGDVTGLAVSIAARVEAAAAAGEVLASRTVVDLVAGSNIAFVDRGEHALKGVPATWQLFAVGA